MLPTNHINHKTKLTCGNHHVRRRREAKCGRQVCQDEVVALCSSDPAADGQGGGCMLDGRVCRKPELSHLGRQLDAPAKTDQAVHQRPTCPRLHDRVLQNLQQG